MSLILLVRDNKNNSRVLEDSLLKEGFRVISATGNRNAAKLIREEKPDLIILGVAHPEGDGYDLFRTLKANRKTAAIPLIVLGADCAGMETAPGNRRDMDDYITGPFTPGEVIARVKAQLRRAMPSGKVVYRTPLSEMKPSGSETLRICSGKRFT